MAVMFLGGSGAFAMGGPSIPSGGIGVAEFAVTTGTVVAVEGGPSVTIPGLERNITVSEGSNLHVQVDLREWGLFVHGGCPGYVGGALSQHEIAIEINGLPVASREFFGDFGNLSNVLGLSIVWLSTPLAAGEYQVRVVVVPGPDDGDSNPGETTSCLGSSENDGRQGRMVIMELLAPR